MNEYLLPKYFMQTSNKALQGCWTLEKVLRLLKANPQNYTQVFERKDDPASFEIIYHPLSKLELGRRKRMRESNITLN